MTQTIPDPETAVLRNGVQVLSRREITEAMKIVDTKDPRYVYFARLALRFQRDDGNLDPEVIIKLWDAAERARQIDERLMGKEREHRTKLNYGVAPSVVYYLQVNDTVKIGTTTNLLARVNSLTLRKVIGLEPGDHVLEKKRHQQFRSDRTEGEWFRLSQALRAHIDSLPSEWKEKREDLVLIDRSDAQAILGISRTTMWTWCDAGKFTRFPGNKVDQAEVWAMKRSMAGK